MMTIPNGRRHEAHTPCPIFSVPPLGLAPFGHSTQLRIFSDPDLLQYDEVWAAAGTWNDVFPIDPRELARVSEGVVVELKRDSQN